MTKVCIRCKKQFNTSRKVAKYCSMQCYNPILKVIKSCQDCNKKFKVHKFRINTAKFCSYTCRNKAYKELFKGKNNPFYGKTQVGWGKGKKFPERSNNNHFAWKGENAGYISKHMWIKSHWGKPIKCENPDCFYPRRGKTSHRYYKSPKRFEWANISGKYLRKKSDWFQLCPSCHRLFDLGKLILIR